VNRARVEPAPPAQPGPPTEPLSLLRYEPGWLPDGMTEQLRHLDGLGYDRTWRNGTAEVKLAVHPVGDPDDLVPRFLEHPENRVDLGRLGEGFSQRPVNPNDPAALMWTVGRDNLVLVLHDVPNATEVARQIATSMREDGTEVLKEAIHVAPDLRAAQTAADMAERRWRGTSPTDWAVEYELVRVSRVTVVRLTPTSPDTTGGQAVRARGVEATYVPPRQQDGGTTDPLLVVPVAAGFLTIGGKSSVATSAQVADLPLEKLVDIANTTVVDDVDVSWFGTR